MTSSSVFSTSSDKTSASWWGAFLLGAVFILAGFFVLGDVALATVISTIVIGLVVVVAGVAEIIHAFSAAHWQGFLLRLLIGALYGVAGLMLIRNPLGASAILTLVFAVALLASGIVRIFQAFQYWRWAGPLLLLSGIVGILAGLVILLKWPISGLWVLGLVVGIDLLLHGIWWISLGMRLRQERKAVPT